MFRSRSSLQQHTNKYIQKNALNRNGIDSSTSRNALESQTLHDGSHLLPCLPNTPFRPPFHYSLHQISSSSDSTHAQSSRSEPLLSQHVLQEFPSSSKQTSTQHTVSASDSTRAQSSRSEPLLPQHVLHEFPSSSQQTLTQHTVSASESTRAQSCRSEPLLPQHVLHEFPSSSQQTLTQHTVLASESTRAQSSRSEPLLPQHTLELKDDESEDKLMSEVEIIDQHGNILRTAKMTTKDVYKLNAGEQILVHVNDRDQLIKDTAGLCTRFMTVLLKQPNLCPIEAKDWREVRTRCGVRLMAELRRKFCISQGTKMDWVLFKIFNQKYRALKYRMKYKLYGSVKGRLDEANNIGVDEAHELEYTEDQILNALDLVDAPPKVHDHQWESYKAQLRSSKSRKLSEIGKKARSEKLHTHRTGAKSFARVRYEFKSKNKRSPLFVEAFEIEHQATDGSYVEDASRELVDKANKEISRKISELGCPEEEIDNEKRAAIDREVWVKLKGPEGEALGFGAGVTKSQVTSFNNELRKMRGENFMNSNYVHKLLVQTKSQTSIIESQNRTIVSLNKTVETLNKTVESQNEKMAVQNQKLESQTKKVEELENTVGGFKEELKLFQTMFQRAYGSSDMCFPTQTGSHEDYTGYGKEKNMQSSWKN